MLIYIRSYGTALTVVIAIYVYTYIATYLAITVLAETFPLNFFR